MLKNTILLVILAIVLVAAFTEQGNSMRGMVMTGNPMPTVQVQQQLPQAQVPQGQPQLPNQNLQQALQGNQTEPMQGQIPSQILPPGSQPAVQPYATANPGTMNMGTGNSGMGNMGMGGCGMMGNMGGMGMGNMGGMGMGNMGMGGMGMGGMNMPQGTMNMPQSGLGHTMDQGLTMKEIVFIVSMQDALQLMSDMIRIQEQLMDASTSSQKKTELRQDLAQVKEKTRKLIADYRGMLTNQVKSD